MDLPSCGQGIVKKTEESDDGNQECDNSLEDEQPLPSRETSSVIHSMEDARSNQASKCSREDISSIQNRNSSRNLLSCVEDAQHIDCSGIVWCFSQTKKEADKEETSVVVNDGCECADDGPRHHCDAHVATWSGSSEEHVGGDLAEEVADEEDAETGLVF